MAGRRAKRFTTKRSLSVGFIGANARFTGELGDLSSNGLFIRCLATVPEGTVGKIGIPVGPETIRGVGVVRRVIPNEGVGIEITQMASRDRNKLQHLLLLLAKHSF